MKIVTILGARPQFIKASALSREFIKNKIDEVIVHTGQHYDANMSDIFFQELEIPKPKYQFDIKSKFHGEMTGRMLEQIEKVLLDQKPDWVLVYGDTNSTLAGALAASKLNIPVAHVEAGLRSFNRTMPEEINRLLTDHISTLLFAPTESAVANLVKEGVAQEKIHNVGDIMYDVSVYFGKKSSSELLNKFRLQSKNYIMATCHRQENTNSPERLRVIFEALQLASEKIPVICPLHPRTKTFLQQSSWFNPSSNLQLVEPLGYLEMVALEKNAAVVATDSGGVQKEAYFYRVPCVTFRDETEWVELVQSGWNRLVPPHSSEGLRKAILDAIESKGRPVELYGQGDTAQRITQAILKF